MTVAPERLRSVDLLRGGVMIVMALDHVRDFFHYADFDPTEVDKTWPALFFTRWITHFCAPIFVFLAGTGSFLSLSGGRPKREVAWFLLTRGVWLLVVENTIVRFGWSFDVLEPFLFWQVIWAIGWSMIVLAGLVFLPLPVIAGFGAVMVLGHDLLDPFDGRATAAVGALWRVLHAGGPVHVAGKVNAWAAYPLVPWMGVMALGYAFGSLLQGDAAARRRRLAIVGGALTLAFIVVRAINVYGDKHPWEPQRSPLFTLMSFLACSKYPPSLLYLLMTIGPAILLLAAMDRARGEGLAKPVLLFGRVPMFYYLLHIILIHGLVLVAGTFHYGHFMPQLAEGPFSGERPEGWGYNLATVYAIWVGVLVLLYPACAWFAGVKRRRNDAWLRYL
jgi:uncharacterized membrane protein